LRATTPTESEKTGNVLLSGPKLATIRRIKDALTVLTRERESQTPQRRSVAAMTTAELQQRISKHSDGTDGLKGKKKQVRVNEG
jgi:hypothetical protein